MANDTSAGTPKSPEVQEAYVRQELDQEQITHEGVPRKAGDSQGAVLHGEKHKGAHLGAIENDNLPVVPPMSGPADLVGEHDENAQGNDGPGDDEELWDPRDELTPG